LVAKEFDISLPENSLGRMPIKKVVSGMRNVSITGRVFKISKINEFKKSNGSAGRVSNIFIGDNTGVIRVPLWDEQVKLLEEGTISVGDIIQVGNGLARENTFGEVEISLGRFGSINILEDFVDLPSAEELLKMSFNISPERADISDAISGGSFELKGTIAQVFRGNFLFEVCPLCNGKVEDSKCMEHGDVAPSHAMVVSFILDDGTDDLRCVSFRKSAEELIGMPSEELSKLEPEERYGMVSSNLLGREIILSGRIKKNKMSGRMEMMVNGFKDINPLEESKRLVDEIELMVGA